MGATAPHDRDPEDRLSRQLRFYRRLSFLLIVAALVPCAVLAARWVREYATPLGIMLEVDASAPHGAQIADLIRPLRYSIAPILLRPDVRIELDFENRKWHIRNLHRFDQEGRIVLEQGRYGVCGELSAYSYDRLKRMMDPGRFEVAIIRVAESGFFPAYMTEHFAVEVVDRATTPPAEYILDTSLKRYGLKSRFEDYLIFERLTNLAFMETHEPDQTFRADSGTPVDISGRYLVVLSVERQGGAFDANNFRISLVAFHRNHYIAHPLIFLRSVNGRREVLEYPETIRKVMSQKKYGVLREKLIEQFDRL